MTTIPIINIGLAFFPVVLVLVVMFYWSLNITDGFVALSRMLIQLLLIGYALTWVFSVDSSLLVLAILSFMLLVASSIAVRPLSDQQKKGDYWRALFSIALGGGLTLFFVVFFVLNVDPWYKPTTIIPLAGMIFASSMNTISISAERFIMELKNGSKESLARNQAYKTGLIPCFQQFISRRTCIPSRNDDWSNSLWRFTTHCCPISNSRNVYVDWGFWNCSGNISPS
jgi:putative ABC transport system permease protein